MPIHWQIDHRASMVYVTVHGRLTYDEFVAYLDKLFLEQALPYPKLVDMLAYAPDNYSQEEFLAMSARVGAYGKNIVDRGPLAIVTKDPSVIMAIKRFVNLTKDERRPVKVFRLMSKARAWLEDQRIPEANPLRSPP